MTDNVLHTLPLVVIENVDRTRFSIESMKQQTLASGILSGIYMLSGDKAYTTVLLPPSNEHSKEITCLLRSFALEYDVDEVWLFSEGWGVMRDANDPYPLTSVHEEPDRVEVFVCIHEKFRYSEGWLFKIIRDREGKIMDLIPIPGKAHEMVNNHWIINRPHETVN